MASILNVDKIRRQAGSTDALVIDSGDRVTTPTRPAFRARKTSTQTASGSNELVTWDTVFFNTGSHFASNVFTAPVAGLYQFSIIALSPSNSSIEDFHFGYTPSGGSFTSVAKFRNSSSSGHETTSGTVIYQMGVGDIFGVYLVSASDAIYGDSDVWTTWNGHLVG